MGKICKSAVMGKGITHKVGLRKLTPLWNPPRCLGLRK